MGHPIGVSADEDGTKNSDKVYTISATVEKMSSLRVVHILRRMSGNVDEIVRLFHSFVGCGTSSLGLMKCHYRIPQLWFKLTTTVSDTSGKDTYTTVEKNSCNSFCCDVGERNCFWLHCETSAQWAGPCDGPTRTTLNRESGVVNVWVSVWDVDSAHKNESNIECLR